MSIKEFLPSTIDNPFNPFKNFDNWNQFDLEKGYNSLSLLARVCDTSNELTDEENIEETNRAVDEIVKFDPFGIRIKVSEDSIIKPISIDEIISLQKNENEIESDSIKEKENN